MASRSSLGSAFLFPVCFSVAPLPPPPPRATPFFSSPTPHPPPPLSSSGPPPPLAQGEPLPARPTPHDLGIRAGVRGVGRHLEAGGEEWRIHTQFPAGGM